MSHTHKTTHLPPGGTGYAVCSCGATIRVQDGLTVGAWHTCEICAPIPWQPIEGSKP